MTRGRPRRVPSRRGAVAVLAAVAAAVVAIIGLAVVLAPPEGDVPPLPDPVVATCEDPLRGRAPVPVTSGTLYACPQQFDGRVVLVRGEAVGDVLDGPGDRSWVQVNDDAYAAVGPLRSHGRTLGLNSGVAVLLPLGERPDTLGGPGVWGDRLEVVGEYQVASDADQGGPAIIADAIQRTADGGPVDRTSAVALHRATPLAVLVTVGIGVAVQRRRLAG